MSTGFLFKTSKTTAKNDQAEPSPADDLKKKCCFQVGLKTLNLHGSCYLLIEKNLKLVSKKSDHTEWR